MLVKEETRPRLRNGKPITGRIKIIYTYSCDECGNLFESKRPASGRRRHYCTSQCRIEARKLGKLGHQDFVETCQRRFGRDNPEIPRQPRSYVSKEIRDEQRRAALKIARQKACQKYGVTSVSKLDYVKEKLKRCNRVASLTKSRETLLARYGVTCPYQIPRIRERALSQEAQAKRMISFKATASKISRAERLLTEKLIEIFGAENVEIQRTVCNKWPIDIYIKLIDTYVQVDGIYWHGLDRPKDVIERSTNPRDVVILRKMSTDVEQNNWFKASNLRLIRVTDIDIKRNIDAVIEIFKQL